MLLFRTVFGLNMLKRSRWSITSVLACSLSDSFVRRSWTVRPISWSSGTFRRRGLQISFDFGDERFRGSLKKLVFFFLLDSKWLTARSG